MSLHIPKIEITTQAPTDQQPFVEGILTDVRVDGTLWPVLGYQVEQGVNNAQKIILTLYADVTITHRETP